MTNTWTFEQKLLFASMISTGMSPLATSVLLRKPASELAVEARRQYNIMVTSSPGRSHDYEHLISVIYKEHGQVYSKVAWARKEMELARQLGQSLLGP